MKVALVIPARFSSQRLPGKPLLTIGSKPMIQLTHELAQKVRGVDRVLVATDDQRILDCVQGFGGEAVLTSAEARSGTDRLAELALKLDFDLWVNLQGDEPFLEPGVVSSLIQAAKDSKASILSAMVPIHAEEIADPSVVKVIVNQLGRAIYFSRLPIPFGRMTPQAPGEQKIPCYRHLGIYLYDRVTLLRFPKLHLSALEQAEGLEQLRFLDAGFEIQMVEVQTKSIGIDTAQDLDRARRELELNG